MKRYIELIKQNSLRANVILKNKNLQILFLSILSMLFFYNFLLSTGFISDDAYNSQILGSILIAKETITKRFLTETWGWFFGSGRILFWYNYFLYYFTQSEIVVKSLVIAVMTLGLYFFSLLTGKISKSKIVALLSVLCMPAIFQVRAWHDPIIAFTFIIPLLFLYLASSLYYFQCYLEEGRKKYLFISVFTLLFGLLTYELSYLFFFCHLALVLFYKGTFKEKFLKSLPILVVSFSVVLVSILAKTKLNPYFNNGYPGAGIHFDISSTLQTFLYQSISGIPLSYYLGTKPNMHSLMPWEVVGLYIFFGIIFYCLQKNKTVPKLRFFVLGSAMFFPPAMIISLSGHQEEIIKAGIGYGYLSVYFQYFGFFLIFLSGFYLLRSNLQKWSAHWFQGRSQVRFDTALVFFCAVLFTYVGKIHLKQNKAVAKSTNYTFLYPRKVLGTSIEHGILDPVKNEDLIFQNRRFPSDHDWFFATTAKRSLNVCDLTEVKTIPKCSLKQLFGIGDGILPSNNKPSLIRIDLKELDKWSIVYSFDAENGERGVAILAKLDEVVIDQGKNEILQIRVGSRLRIFDYLEKTMTEVSLPASSVDFFKIIETSVPLSSKDLNFSTYKPKDLFGRWYGKVHPFEGTAENNVRWSSGDAELVVYSLYEKPVSVELKASFARPGNNVEKSVIKIVENSNVEVKPLNANAYLYNRKKTLKPGPTSFHFSSDGKVVSEDPRNIVFGIFNFLLTEVGPR